MATEDFHLVPHIEGWAIKREGAPMPQSIHRTREEAIEAGRRLAVSTRGKLLIHGRDGIVVDRETEARQGRQGR